MAQAPSRDRQREFLAEASADWPDSTGECAYGIFDSEGGVLGAIGLGDHLGPKALEIGYWCPSAHTGRGLITRSVAALTDIALALPDIGTSKSTATPPIPVARRCRAGSATVWTGSSPGNGSRPPTPATARSGYGTPRGTVCDLSRGARPRSTPRRWLRVRAGRRFPRRGVGRVSSRDVRPR
ncbi:GNAT family N-acetyltransferase [Nocardia sp. NBC_01377]